MKKNILNAVVLAAGLVAWSSCSDDERPLPESKANFEVLSTAPETFVPVVFGNLSLNAARYVWEYGDGAKDSSESVINGSHIYEEPGTYTVKLKAYNEDGAFKETEKEVIVGQRYLTSAAILNISMLDPDGNIWDEDGSGPDVVWQMGRHEATSIEEIIGVYIEDLNKGSGAEDDLSTPIGISTDDLIPQDFLLSNEDFFIQLEEVDTVDSKPVYNPMVGITFNPVVQTNEDIATSYKFDDGTGFIQIPFIVIGQYQFIMNFEIR